MHLYPRRLSRDIAISYIQRNVGLQARWRTSVRALRSVRFVAADIEDGTFDGNVGGILGVGALESAVRYDSLALSWDVPAHRHISRGSPR